MYNVSKVNEYLNIDQNNSDYDFCHNRAARFNELFSLLIMKQVGPGFKLDESLNITKLL